MWDYQRSGQQTITIPTQHSEPQKTDHRSPAKIKRDAERADQKRINENLDQMLNAKHEEINELADELDGDRFVERKLVNANTWTDMSYPQDPDSRGVVPWPGEVLQRKRGRRIIYVHASMIPR
ncbi:MAG: hypothetical protein ABSF63_01220 [Candidatus Bathyarchaeia archaeon]|jgi:hypothetical protein